MSKNRINNISVITPLLEFPNEDVYYFLQLLQRKKEHKNLGRNSNNIKNYYIRSIDYLNKKMPEIIGLCNYFNARAYIRLTPRSFKKTAFHNLRQVSTFIESGDYKAVSKSYLSASGTTNAGFLKRWIIDIDDNKYDEDRIRAAIKYSLPDEGRDKVLAKIFTKNGYHLITEPFDIMKFKSSSRIIELDIHKDNPTCLYIP